MNFEETMRLKTQQIESKIAEYLPADSSAQGEVYQKTVIQAMNYSILSGGKRLRPMLMRETSLLFGEDTELTEPFMAALEMIHTYSLVHDDLPCMDNDEYRRGRKTTWSVYGEGMATLAGDGLLNYAFETACKAFGMESAGLKVGRAMTVLAQKAGVFGMIGGQCADIEAERLAEELITKERLLYIHEHKTAALIECAMMIGAILAGAAEEDVKSIERIASKIGIAFQIQDDILDVTSSLEVLGKQTGSDEKNHKITYVSLNGLESSRQEVRRLSEEALKGLASFERRNLFLEELVKELITRVN